MNRAVLCRSAAAAASLAVLGTSASAQGRPDFAGTWVMDTAQARRDQVGLQAMMITVEERGDTLRMSRMSKGVARADPSFGDMANTWVVYLDGERSSNRTTRGGLALDVTTTARWQGSSLIITNTTGPDGQAVHQTDIWTLSSTGKTLTTESITRTMGAEFSVKLLFNKQRQ
jgi:hypothetical protein